MKNFIKNHGEKIITICVGASLLSTLDWSWSNVKSFLSGGVIAFYIWLIFTAKERD